MRPRKHNRQLPACVYQRRGKYYLVKRGKWHPLGADLSQALAQYAKLIEDTPEQDAGMVSLLNRLLPVLIAGRADATRKLYTICINRLKEILIEFSPEQVMPKHVAELRNALADTPRMANKCVQVLKLVMDKAMEEGIIDRNPCVGVRLIPIASRTRRVTHEEFWQIHAKASPRLRSVMMLCYLTGQRIGDVLKIQRADLTDTGIYVKQSKTGAELVIGWTPELREAVEFTKSLQGKVAHLQLIRWKYRTIYGDWRTAIEQAEVAHCTPHDLRAMAGSDAKRQGVNPQALLGHTSERTTRIYLRDHDVPVVQGPSIGQSIGQK